MHRYHYLADARSIDVSEKVDEGDSLCAHQIQCSEFHDEWVVVLLHCSPTSIFPVPGHPQTQLQHRSIAQARHYLLLNKPGCDLNK